MYQIDTNEGLVQFTYIAIFENTPIYKYINSKKQVKFISKVHSQGVDSYIITWIAKIKQERSLLFY